VSDGTSYHNAPGLVAPAGHYSHVTIARGLAFVAGQLPLDKQGTPLTGAPFADQARQALQNLDACLTAVSLTRADLVQVRVYVTNVGDWPEFDALYAQWLGGHRPARAVAGVNELHFGVAVEVEAVAALPTA